MTAFSVKANKHFSVDTSVCLAAQDRTGLERLLRYCARPPFALDWLRKAVMVCSQRRTGTKLAKRHPTLRPISASVGEGQNASKNSELTAARRQAAPGTANAWDSRHISGNWR
ncbi:hypothetical protein [Limnohabitans sp. Rim8]|uniref:hypothetical protein n=1 Tax=Limnohabitans sp. Rim8 TaxID=1100718 RepID=UPI0033063C7F